MSLRTAKSDLAFMNALFTAAEREAHALGDEIMGAEHLVIAALSQDHGDASAFRSLGLDADEFRAAVVSAHTQALDGVGIDGTPAPFADPPRGALQSTASAQQVFQAARKRAKAARSALRPSDVVAAAAGLDHGTTARALAHLGIDRAALDAVGA